MLRRSVKPVSELVKRVHKYDLATVPSEDWSEIFHDVKSPTYDFKVNPSKRLSTPPQFKALESYCHYPILIVATPTITNTAGYKNATVVPKSNACAFTKEYFVDVPFEVCPGELFRVLIAGDEHLVSCPDITSPGERIVVTVGIE